MKDKKVIWVIGKNPEFNNSTLQCIIKELKGVLVDVSLYTSKEAACVIFSKITSFQDGDSSQKNCNFNIIFDGENLSYFSSIVLCPHISISVIREKIKQLGHDNNDPNIITDVINSFFS